MAKRYYSAAETNRPVSYDTALPTDAPIAIYYRQSTEAQIGNISTTLQTVDMVKYLKAQGWDERNILMIDMDAGISGTTKIDERPGMSRLFGLITQNQIGAVACQDEDRLFRDVTQIQVNIFIEACRAYKVTVLTPSMAYHFDHEQLGAFHARQFRFRSEMAADYISTVIKGKMLRAKESLLMNGKWAGAAIPVGFMVDTRKLLPDGSRNEQWRRLAVFEPYARVVREYFRLYLSYTGNAAETLRHIRRKGPYFPDPGSCIPPEGFRVIYKIKQNQWGWCPNAKQSLIQMFTNAAYAGHWVAGNVVVRWNNHPAIIDASTFYQAFNYLSTVTLGGETNADYRRLRLNHRPEKDRARSEGRPLFSGLIFSRWEGKFRQAGTEWQRDKKGYYYVLIAGDGLSTPVWHKKASYFDATVVDLLLTKLRLTFDFEAWEAAVDVSIQDIKAEWQLKTAQLAQLDTVMENLAVSLGALSTPQLIAAVEKRYQEAQAEQARLRQEVGGLAAHIADIEGIDAVRTSYSGVLENWEQQSVDERREVIHAFVEKIDACKTQDHEIHLTVFWRDGSSDAILLPRTAPGGTIWLPQEVERLIELMESGISKLEIAKAFPERKWKDLVYKYRYVTKKPSRYRRENTLMKHESYQDYRERVARNGSLGGESEVCWTRD